jgi:hypothetical protein
MSSFALAISRGPTNLALRVICAKGAAALGNCSVEVLLPEGGCRLSLSCSGWSAVLGVDADGGTPDGDVTNEGGGQMAARWCPCGLFAAVAGAVSDLICKTGNELRPLCQVLAPNVMIMKR